MYYLNSLWMVYMLHKNYDWVLILHDLVWLCWCINIYIYICLHDNSYKGFYPNFTSFHSIFYDDDYIATRPLWTDLWRGRIWAWLMLWCAHVMGGVVGISTTTDLGCSRDATVSPRGLPKPTLVVGFGILYLMVLLKPICKCFMCIRIMI